MQVHHDAIWFERFLSVSKNTVDYEWLRKFTKISASEQIRFYENQVENPAIHCQGVSKVTGHDALLALKEDILQTEKNPTIADLYVRKIDNQLMRYEMLSATIEGDDELFTLKSQELYGKPRKKYFAYIAKQMQSRLVSDNAKSQADAAKVLGTIFSKIDTSSVRISNDVLPEPVADEQTVLSAEQVKTIFEDVLAEHELFNWEVEVDKTGDRPRFAVNPSTQVVHIPSDKRLAGRKTPLTRTAALALAEHEVGVHVRRFESGSQQPLLLLRLGLDNYLPGEEGIASYVQQQIEGADEYYGFDRYLAISLAMGLDGEQRDFRALYSVMLYYYQLMLPPDTDEQLHHNAAWDVCTRVFRGSTGQGVGTVFTRDLAYFEGNIDIWELLIASPERYTDFFVGKYNPLDNKHVTALQALAILPK